MFSRQHNGMAAFALFSTMHSAVDRHRKGEERHKRKRDRQHAQFSNVGQSGQADQLADVKVEQDADVASPSKRVKQEYDSQVCMHNTHHRPCVTCHASHAPQPRLDYMQRQGSLLHPSMGFQHSNKSAYNISLRIEYNTASQELGSGMFCLIAPGTFGHAASERSQASIVTDKSYVPFMTSHM